MLEFITYFASVGLAAVLSFILSLAICIAIAELLDFIKKGV